MSTHGPTKRRDHELIELWLRANEGQATDEQLQALSRSLETDPHARQLILSVSQMQGWLSWQGGPTPSIAAARCDAKPVAPHRNRAAASTPWRDRFHGWASRVWNTRLLSPQAALSVACLVAAVMWIQQLAWRTTDSTPFELLDVRIVGGTPCVWDSAGVPHDDLNQPLREGDSLQLLEGIAKLSLRYRSSPAELDMEGPAAVLLARHAVPSLRYGKITIKTNSLAAEPFPVETLFGRVMVEAGSEVGISAFGGSAQVHVFAGVVSIESPWFMTSAPSVGTKVISAGEALFFEGVGDVKLQVTAGNAHRDRFTPQISMQSDFLAVGPQYVQQIKEARPVAYWRFEEDDRHADQTGEYIRNHVRDGFHGRLRGKVHWVGPHGNQAIEFGVTPEPGSMIVDDSWDDVLDGDFTLETWIKPSHYHLGSILGFIGDFDWRDHRNKHGVLLEVGGTSRPSSTHQPESLRFLHRPKLGVQGGVSCFSERNYLPRQWQHVAAIRHGNELRLHLDGELVSSKADAERLGPGLQLVLGQLYSETVERFFIGHVDEVAIYDRALSAEEIRRHYQLLRPARKPAASPPAATNEADRHSAAPLSVAAFIPVTTIKVHD